MYEVDTDLNVQNTMFLSLSQIREIDALRTENRTLKNVVRFTFLFQCVGSLLHENFLQLLRELSRASV